MLKMIYFFFYPGATFTIMCQVNDSISTLEKMIAAKSHMENCEDYGIWCSDDVSQTHCWLESFKTVESYCLKNMVTANTIFFSNFLFINLAISSF